MSTYTMEYWVEPLETLDMVMREYVELTPYEMLFEADNPDISKQMRQNANLENQADSAITKLIKGLLGLVGRIIETITDFFGKLFMNGNDRAAFEEMQRELNKLPGHENMKMTLKDFKAEKARIQQMVKDSNAAINAIDKDQSYGAEMLDKMDTMLKEGVAPAVGEVAMDVAVRAAQSNADTAKWIKTLLTEDRSKLAALEQIVGKKSAKNFRKEIDKCTKKAGFYRARINLFGKHYKNLQDVILDVAAEVNNLTKGHLSLCNIGLALKLFRNKKVRKNMLNPAIKKGVKGIKNDINNAVYNTLNPNQPENDKGVLGFITGR